MKDLRHQRGQATVETVILAVATLSVLIAGAWAFRQALQWWLWVDSAAMVAPSP